MHVFVYECAAPILFAMLVVAEGLEKRFGWRRAVSGVSLSLDAGDCLALFGPNGAGKTTLLRILAGLVKPNAGTARIGDVLLPGGLAARRRVGLISHRSMLYDALTALENVEFAARLYGVRDARAAAINALTRLGIADRADSPVRSLSRGMQQRVSIARAIAHRPDVLLLDEPFSGLDEAGASALTSALTALRAQGATMVLVTHNLAEGLALASRVAVMRDGTFVRVDDRAAIDAAAYGATYRATVADGN